MKRVLLILIMFAGFAAATTPAVAMAPTCGGSALADDILHTGPPTHWTVQWDQNCGSGKTIEWQIQESPDGTAPWTTDTDRFHATDPGDANHWVTMIGNDTTFTCSNSKFYRLRVIWADGSSTVGFNDGFC